MHYFEQIVSLSVVLTQCDFNLFIVLIMLTIKLLLLLCSHIKKRIKDLLFIPKNIDLFRKSIELRNFLNDIFVLKIISLFLRLIVVSFMKAEKSIFA